VRGKGKCFGLLAANQTEFIKPLAGLCCLVRAQVKGVINS
jgi:hypothetical protein